MPFRKYILNFLHCNVFAQKKLVATTFEVSTVTLNQIYRKHVTIRIVAGFALL